MRLAQRLLRPALAALAIVGFLTIGPGASGSLSLGRLTWTTEAGPDPAEVYTARGDGSDFRRLFRVRSQQIRVALSPDGTTLATSEPENPRAVSARAQRGVVALRRVADGSRLRVVVRLGPGEFSERVAWAPSGRRLAYTTRRGIWTVGVDGSGRRLVTRRAGTELAWSPTGRELAFVTEVAGARREIWVLRADGRGLRRVAIGVYSTAPSWSPDGRRIVFSSNPYPQRNGTMYVVNVSTGTRRVIGRGEFPRYSRDGRQVAFFFYARPTVDGIRVGISTSSGAERRLIRARWPLPGAPGPIWSPDGAELALVAQWRVVAIRADGSGQRTLGETLVEVRDLDWRG